MNEWKAAGWVFGVLAIIGIGILFYANREKHMVATYRRCKFDFVYIKSIDTLNERYDAAHREFGKCLCELYLENPDSVLGKLIVKQGIQYGYPAMADSIGLSAYQSLDSLLKYRKEVFDPVILWD